MAEPTKVIAGDTWTWTRSGGDYPASAGWALTYFMSLPDGTIQQVQASASGADFQVAVSATSSAGWVPGLYNWTARVVNGSEAHTVDSGTMRVSPDPATVAAPASHAVRCLAQIEAALEKCFGDAIVEFDLDGFKVKKNRTELVNLRTHYQAEVKRERGQLGMRIIPVRLG